MRMPRHMQRTWLELFADRERDDGGHVAREEVLAAGRDLPRVALRQVRVARSQQAPGGVKASHTPRGVGGCSDVHTATGCRGHADMLAHTYIHACTGREETWRS